MNSLYFLIKSQPFGEFPNSSNWFSELSTHRTPEAKKSIFVASEQGLDVSAVSEH